MHKRLSEISTDINRLREKGRQRGREIGWPWEMLPITIKPGSTTYVAAAPFSGKTELWFEILINLSCKSGWKHLIFSPETGDHADVYAELIHKFAGKPVVKGKQSMDDSEFMFASQFVDEHFLVVDPIDADLTLVGFYELADKIENQFGWKFHTTTIDPWNELKEEFEPEDLGREDKYLSRILGVARKNARKTGRHNCIINHVRDQAMVKDGNNSFYPMPTARDMAGGQVWFRKGNLMLIPWRPPAGVEDENGIKYLDNELALKVAKSKPKGVALNGVYKIFLDVDRYQYYMMHNGRRVYADRGEYSVKPEVDLINFSEPSLKDDLPF